MIIETTDVYGCFVLELEQFVDDRGSFARSFCPKELKEAGVPFELEICQTNIAINKYRGTLRGMHWQAAPKPDAKIVRAVRGAIYDVVADIRLDSPTFGKWTAHELTADNRKAVLAPPGCAHGLITLVDDSEVHYQMGEFYYGELTSGLRWNDPLFDIKWPLDITVISERDATYPDFVK